MQKNFFQLAVAPKLVIWFMTLGSVLERKSDEL